MAYVIFILTEEQTKIKGEIAGRDVPVLFDGTTRLEEAMVVVVCLVSDEWTSE